jgi:hypothetical protein
MELAEKILNGLRTGKPQRKFLLILFATILAIRGKVNFRNLSRYSQVSEKTYARQFARDFEFVDFNRRVIDQTFGLKSERVLAFDPTFVPKAGKHTFGRDRFWNGVRSRAERGLEISCLAVVDLRHNQGLTLSVRQTLPKEEFHSPARPHKREADETLIDQYLDHIRAVRPSLASCEQYLCVDGGLVRIKLIDGVRALGLHLIGKLRCDADMRYLYDGPRRPGRGRRKTYGSKADWRDLAKLEYVGSDDGIELYTRVLNHVHFKRNVRVVLLLLRREGKEPSYVLLFSTDVELNPWKIYRYYKARFQVEFLFRDAKQFTGLCDCQARSKQRLGFHFNASLCALNLAKSEQMMNHQGTELMVCSLASTKAQYFNEHYLDRIISIFGLDPNWVKNHPEYQQLRNYGKIAA